MENINKKLLLESDSRFIYWIWWEKLQPLIDLPIWEEKSNAVKFYGDHEGRRDPDSPRNTNQIQIFQSLAPPITFTHRMWKRNGIVDSDSKVYGFLFLLTFLIKDCNQSLDVNETCFHVLKFALRACVYIKGIVFLRSKFVRNWRILRCFGLFLGLIWPVYVRKTHNKHVFWDFYTRVSKKLAKWIFASHVSCVLNVGEF